MQQKTGNSQEQRRQHVIRVANDMNEAGHKSPGHDAAKAMGNRFDRGRGDNRQCDDENKKTKNGHG